MNDKTDIANRDNLSLLSKHFVRLRVNAPFQRGTLLHPNISIYTRWFDIIICLPSSQPIAFVKKNLVYILNITNASVMAVTIAKEFIVPEAREAGSMKFGSTPRGGASAGTLDRSVPGGIARDIAMLLLRIEKIFK